MEGLVAKNSSKTNSATLQKSSSSSFSRLLWHNTSISLRTDQYPYNLPESGMVYSVEGEREEAVSQSEIFSSFLPSFLQLGNSRFLSLLALLFRLPSELIGVC